MFLKHRLQPRLRQEAKLESDHWYTLGRVPTPQAIYRTT